MRTEISHQVATCLQWGCHAGKEGQSTTVLAMSLSNKTITNSTRHKLVCYKVNEMTLVCHLNGQAYPVKQVIWVS